MGDLPPNLGITSVAKRRLEEEIGERWGFGTDKEDGGGEEQPHGPQTNVYG